MSEAQQKFEGWAILELFGHAKIAGYVTTEYYGNAAFFRVDVPELPEREETITRPEYVESEQYSGYAYPGSVLKRAAEPGFTRHIGPGAVYSMNPCTQAAVRDFREREGHRRPIVPITLVTERSRAIAPAADPDDEEGDF